MLAEFEVYMFALNLWLSAIIANPTLNKRENSVLTSLVLNI
jgi:hypothetical protein